MRNLIGRIGLAYALRTPSHRGKFRILHTLDRYFGPFVLQSGELRLTALISSSMDVSYFRQQEPDTGIQRDTIDAIAPTLIAELRAGDVFVDVGANIGYLSLLASRRVQDSGLVLAFEPSSREYRRLLTNISLNGANNIIPVHAALGRKDEIAEFEIAPHHTGLNRLQNAGTKVGSTVKTPVFTAAGFLTLILGDRAPTLIKIDVEGAEYNVLYGMQSYLQAKRPQRLVVEITPKFLKDYGSSRDQVYQLMNGLGYRPLFSSSAEQYDEVFERK